MALTLPSGNTASAELRAAVSFFALSVECKEVDGDAEPTYQDKTGLADVAAALFDENTLATAEFDKWVRRAPKQLLPQLNKALELRTFVHSPSAIEPSLSDVLLFVRAHPLVAAQKAAERNELNHATRWWAHMQHLMEGHTSLAPVQIDLTYKAPKKAADAGAKAAKGDKKGAADEGAKGAKGAKGGKGGKKGGGRGGKDAGGPVESDATKCLMLVGRIVEIERHPNAERLFVEKIDVGEATHRTIISGLVEHYSTEQLQGRRVVVASNLKPATMQGIESCGMVLCACSDGKAKVEVLDAPEGAEPGERVSFEGYAGEPADVCSGKVLARLLKSMKTNADRIATFKDVPMMTKAGPVTVPSLANSSIG
eukprot:TRINITY_DN25598_c0_g1_i1.p1 TRINITY_DN25598_c0_g1~~TRINITY_DN25598_c0_g1_i1.p1  ORF type:complete len:380 (+),score=130.60 TRINITY_DN25598_c0_g1_i1:38-1141(+)